MEAQALWHEGSERSALRAETVRPTPGDVVVRTQWSAISRGTERLVWRGRVPESERQRMRCPNQAGDFPFPVKYGYAAVGVVEHGPPALLGRSVFALHPHQTLFAVPAGSVTPLPDGVPPRRATLAANMETALNAVWDSGATAGDRIAVVGAGPLGLLTAALLARLPGADVALTDVLERRGDIAPHIGVSFTLPSSAPAGCDVAFHTSATESGLATAMAALGPEGTLVEMSWHGEGRVALPLGGAFHALRLKLISSQVGAIPPARRPRWDYARRMALALELLRDPVFDRLITGEVAFADLPARLPDVLEGEPDALATVIRYPDPLDEGADAA
jgi:threonine dehydrogenase-like Zn-dependent dehydrogenase